MSEEIQQEADHLENDKDTIIAQNKFANDGSFLELFRKMKKQKEEEEQQQQQQQQQQQTKAMEKSDNNIIHPHLQTKDANHLKPSLGECNKIENHLEMATQKRKPKALKVGIIKKVKMIDDEEKTNDKTDKGSAWNEYMKEVRKYKEKFGDDDNDKNRPLVK